MLDFIEDYYFREIKHISNKIRENAAFTCYNNISFEIDDIITVLIKESVKIIIEPIEDSVFELYHTLGGE
jgi:hypothetical protein